VGKRSAAAPGDWCIVGGDLVLRQDGLQPEDRRNRHGEVEFEKNQNSRPRFVFFQIREGFCHDCRACHQQQGRRRGHGKRTKPNPTIHPLLASAVWMLRWWWTTAVKAVAVAVMEATGCGDGDGDGDGTRSWRLGLRQHWRSRATQRARQVPRSPAPDSLPSPRRPIHLGHTRQATHPGHKWTISTSTSTPQPPTSTTRPRHLVRPPSILSLVPFPFSYPFRTPTTVMSRLQRCALATSTTCFTAPTCRHHHPLPPLPRPSRTSLHTRSIAQDSPPL